MNNKQYTVIVVGETGSGKSSAANVILAKQVFQEGEFGVSETKEPQKSSNFISGIGTVTAIDTRGLNDTKSTNQEILKKIADGFALSTSGINQVLWVISGKVTPQQQALFGLLTVMFDKSILKYVTIVRTNFSGFRNVEKCNQDIELLKAESKEMKQIIESCNDVIHVNHMNQDADPQLSGRKESQIRLHLSIKKWNAVYNPDLKVVYDRVNNYKTKEQLMQEEIKRQDEVKQRLRKEQEETARRLEEERKAKVEQERKLSEIKAQPLPPPPPPPPRRRRRFLGIRF